jgi:hypothetical protein
MKKVLPFLLLAVVLLSSCERPATRTNWSPINQAKTQMSITALPATLAIAPTQTAVETVPAAGATQIVDQGISPLDLSTLPEQLPDSMKGYELYSWQTGENWNFTLITGTNRTKAFNEIIAPGNSVSNDGFVKISVSGVDDLEKVLGLLPKGENILWGGMNLGTEVTQGMAYLTFPPQEIIDEITTDCVKLQLSLTSLQN